MSSQPALVSILVPVYNAAGYLPELCHSIRAQTYPHYEVLIGDDGSTDNPAAALAPFLTDSRFRLLQWQPNRGLNQGLAILCSAMKGDYWCSPGADDLYQPSFLEKRVEMMEANPHAFCLHGVADLIDEHGKPVQRGPKFLPDIPRQLTAPRSLEVLLEHDIINQPSALLRARMTRQVLPFYHWNWEFSPDWFFWILHAATGFDLLFDNRPLLKYRVHSASLSWAPAKDHVRHAEIRLVPLVALRTATHYSQWAASNWSRWGRTLYWRWLRQAVALKSRGGLKDEWMQLAAHAYYGAKARRVCLLGELAKHGPGLLWASLTHWRAQKRQSFVVSGLAQIEDPIFR
jgi:glycosyltransferase involved in cell wall biosynthesis